MNILTRYLVNAVFDFVGIYVTALCFCAIADLHHHMFQSEYICLPYNDWKEAYYRMPGQIFVAVCCDRYIRALYNFLQWLAREIAKGETDGKDEVTNRSNE